MSEALAGSSTSLERPGTERARRPRITPRPRPTQLGTRYLAFVSAAAVFLGLGLKSELLAPSQVWLATGGLALFTTLGLVFLHARNHTPGWLSLDYYICPVMAVIAAGAVSLLAPDWRLHAIAMVGMGAVIYASSYVDLCRGIGRVRPLHRFLRDSSTFIALLALFYIVLQSELLNVVKFIWIFAIALLSGYRSFRFATQREGLPLLAGFLTAGTVAFAAFGMITYLNQGIPYVAVVLAFIWYAYQGFLVHALDNTLTRRVAFEYGLFGIIAIYFVALAQVTR
ncbi:MAG TPA: hypothetical protein VET65_00170 [Candidatus Limnocylindrales bacterium]|nr:hypothetical protein [Candidatus Limnocylindrales bacterium]